MHQSMKQKSLSVVRLRLSATISELACRRNFFSSSKKKQGLSEIDSSKQHDASNLQVAAHREVRIARRQHREAQDEINLYNSSIIEGTLPASNPEDKNLRKIVINNWVDHQVKSFMKDLSNGMQRPSIAKHDLVVSQSVTCPDGFGEGLFVANGNIPRGSIVAFYPGATYTANEVRWAGSYAKLFDLVKLEDRSYLLGREGGTIFDGASALEGSVSSGFVVENNVNGLRPEAATNDMHTSLLAALYKRGILNPKRKLNEPRNPYALGHKINHPPRGKSANVVGWPYDFNVHFLTQEMIPYVPNWYGLSLDKLDPTSNYGEGDPEYILSTETIVFLAAAEIKDGDEIYLDYGFELSHNNPPEWFSPAALRHGDTESIKKVEWEEYEETTESRLAELEKKLMEWRSSFEEEHGRKATRHDIQNNAKSRFLFDEFARLRQLEWPEEMKNQRF